MMWTIFVTLNTGGRESLASDSQRPPLEISLCVKLAASVSCTPGTSIKQRPAEEIRDYIIADEDVCNSIQSHTQHSSHNCTPFGHFQWKIKEATQVTH